MNTLTMLSVLSVLSVLIAMVFMTEAAGMLTRMYATLVFVAVTIFLMNLLYHTFLHHYNRCRQDVLRFCLQLLKMMVFVDFRVHFNMARQSVETGLHVLFRTNRTRSDSDNTAWWDPMTESGFIPIQVPKPKIDTDSNGDYERITTRYDDEAKRLGDHIVLADYFK